MNDNKKYTNSDKIRFVKDMLELGLKKKLDDSIKEKLLNLIAKEVEQIGQGDENILERLTRVEEIVSKLEPGKNHKEIKENIKPRHLPAQTRAFLNLFNNSKGLKFLTHKFNTGKVPYDEFIETCRMEFEKAKEEYKHLPSSLIGLIENFAFSEKPEWKILSNNHREIIINNGWSEAAFIAWYKNENNIHPGHDAKWNEEMILPFKNSIEVRAGNLFQLINSTLDAGFESSKSSFDIRINKQNLETAEFYTDVSKIKRALIAIFNLIKDFATTNFCFEVEIDFINETLNGGKFKKIIITHIGSEPTKLSNDKDFVKGDLSSISSSLWGLCNYEISAKFPDGYKKRILLTDDFKEYKEYYKKSKSIDMEFEKDKIKGFTHILKFY